MSRVFTPCRSLGYVSNHIPLHVRYIKSRKENLIVTCVGKSYHTYGISHFGLLSVGGLHPEDITCMTVDNFHVYTACANVIHAWRRGTELKHVYRGHKKPVHLMLPFGPHLISIDEASHVKVWDIKDESLFLELTFSNQEFQITTILHPSTYINKILFGSEQGALQLWNINTMKLIYAFKGWKCPVTCLVQAPAVDVVAVGLASGKIILHNLKYDETIMEFLQDWGAVTSLAFRTDGNPIMASGSPNGNIVFWDLDERKVSSQILSAHKGSVTGMVCLSNEPLILTSSPDNTLKLWIFDKSDGGARLLRLREGHSAPPSQIRFHGANGHNILSSGLDSSLRIFNTQTEQFNKSLGRASYNRKASKRKGRLVDDPLIMPPITEFTSETTREKEWDNIAAIHLGLPMVTTWSYDQLRMGELKLLPERFQKKKENAGAFRDAAATCLTLTNCGNFVLVGYNTGHIDRFNIQSGLWRGSYGGGGQAHEGPVRGLDTDPLNQIVVSGGSDSCIKFWKFKDSGAPLSTLETQEPISFFRAHHDSSMLAAISEDFDILIIDKDTRRTVRKFVGHTAQITDAGFSPDSRWLITASMDSSIKTWDIPSGQLIDQFSTEVPCVSLSISPTGEALATAHVDYLGIFLWTNNSIYKRISLKALNPKKEAPLVKFPDCVEEVLNEQEVEHLDEQEFVSQEQISSELVTLSGLAASRWQNLLNLDVIKKRNKPKAPVKAPKSAPFFLPTVSGLNFEFAMPAGESSSKLIMPSSLLNLSEFGRQLLGVQNGDFARVITALKQFSPSMGEFEVKSLSPEGGGSVPVMLQFLKCLEVMLKSNQDFELAEAYLGLFLKEHGAVLAREDSLRGYLTNLQSCHNVVWNRLQEKLLFSISVVQSLKTM